MSYKNGKNRKFFADLDGFVFDFAGARDALGMTSEEFKMMPGAYRNLKPYPGVVENLQTLIEWGWDVWIATKIPDENPLAATEKLFCVREHLPFLSKSVIITPNKGTLGDEYDFLGDDRPHKAHCDEFKGTLLTYGFDNEYKNWDQIMDRMSRHSPLRHYAPLDGEVYIGGQYVRIFKSHNGSENFAVFDDVPESVRDELVALATKVYGRRPWPANMVPASLLYQLSSVPG